MEIQQFYKTHVNHGLVSVCDIKRRTRYYQYKSYLKWKILLLINFTIPDVPISCVGNFFRLALFNLDLKKNFQIILVFWAAEVDSRFRVRTTTHTRFHQTKSVLCELTKHWARSCEPPTLRATNFASLSNYWGLPKWSSRFRTRTMTVYDFTNWGPCLFF